MDYDLDDTLDPKDWATMRNIGHQMLDDMIDYLQNNQKKERLIWRKIPVSVRERFDEPLPVRPTPLETVYNEFKTNILPYNKGNIHPRFFAWVEGTGTPTGMLADMLASGLNANVNIGEHAARYVDRQVVNWAKEMMGFPTEASGLLVSGASMANFTALNVARNSFFGTDVRTEGVKSSRTAVTLYCSTETHACVQKAAEALGLGSDAVRKISVDDRYQINISELIRAIELDLQKGNRPFCVVGNVGTVNTGAIDPLAQLSDICRQYKLWFHIDGAFGALAKLVPEYASELKGIEYADSIAFDFHKWMYMPYEIGCVLIKSEPTHRETFAIKPKYLMNEERGLSAGPEPTSNFGLELSRNFKALKVWMCLKESGLERYSQMIFKNIRQARHLGELIKNSSSLELLAPISLNIVCFRYISDKVTDLNFLNKEIMIALQERGIAAPSSTMVLDQYALRVCIVNQRTKLYDINLLVEQTIHIGNELTDKAL